MSYKVYNDYELLYLVNEQFDSVALEILIKKYKKFIYKKIISFFPREYDLDDYYQEGLYCLSKAIKTFKDKYNKTFMRYFEVLLDRHFINIYHKKKREQEQLTLLINEAYTKNQIVEPIVIDPPKLVMVFKSKKEQFIYDNYFVEGKKIEFIAKKLKLTRKQVYNTIYRVKQKLTKFLVEQQETKTINK